MGAEYRSGTNFSFPNNIGIPMLGVDASGNLTPFSVASANDEATTGQIHVPADNTAAVITRAAETNIAHVVHEMTWSYFGTGTIATGNLKIADGSDTIFDMDISAKGNGQISFPIGRRGHAGRAMTITLAAGGAANIQGKLSATCIKRSSVAGGEINFGDESNSGLIPLLF